MISRRTLASSLFAALGLALLFELPYRWPPTVRTISASYDYGFNNSVGILLLLIWSMAFAVFGYVSRNPKSDTDVAILLPDGEGAVTRRSVIVPVAASLFVVAVCGLLSGSDGYGESTQFVQAMERLASGARPYTDFDLYYGPLMAYVPYAVSVAGRPLGWGFAGSYFVTLAVLQIIGIFELRYLVNRLPMSDRARRAAFWAVALATLPFHTGINLILFRYLTPIVGLLHLNSIRSRSQAFQAESIAVWVTLIFGISVEYGAVFVVALAIHYAGAIVLYRDKSAVLNLIAVLASPLIVVLAVPGLFNTVQLYLMGAWRWPFVPSLALAMFFVATFVLAFAAGGALARLRENFVYLSACVLAAGSLPAALGRCDPGHVMLNGLVILLLAYGWVHRAIGGRTAQAFGGLLILAFGVMYNVADLKIYAPVYLSQAAMKLDRLLSPQQMDRLVGVGAKVMRTSSDAIKVKVDRFVSTKIDAATLTKAVPGSVAAPYRLPTELSAALRQSGRLKLLYFKDYSIIASDLEVQWALRNLSAVRPQFLILPKAFESITHADDVGPLIDTIFSTRYLRQPTRNSRELLAPIVDYVQGNYVKDRPLGGSWIWKLAGSP